MTQTRQGRLEPREWLLPPTCSYKLVVDPSIHNIFPQFFFFTYKEKNFKKETMAFLGLLVEALGGQSGSEQEPGMSIHSGACFCI